MSFRSTVLAAAAFLASANAHIIMAKPVPYSVDKVDSGPINAQQFPCKSNLGFTVSEETTMAVGESQPLSFKGSAVHNGGLCQLSVAMTREPTADTVFKVIKTIEGGCPGLDSATKDFTFELPDSIPNGKATFAWTWMPVSSGGPEFYMNCAPIAVSGGASDDSKFKDLPDMLVANLEGKTTCKQVANTILKAPNPGSVVETGDTAHPLQAPTGECGATGSAPPADSPAPGGSSSAAQEPASSSAAEQPATSSAAGQPTSAPAQPTAVPSNPGGIFAPGASSGVSQSTVTTLVTITSASSAVAAPTAPAGTGSPAEPTAPAAAPSSGAPSSGGSSCTENGAVVCNGATQFGLCNNGQVVWQAVAAGTTCSNGVISKRAYNGRIARPRRVIPGKEFTPDN